MKSFARLLIKQLKISCHELTNHTSWGSASQALSRMTKLVLIARSNFRGAPGFHASLEEGEKGSELLLFFSFLFFFFNLFFMRDIALFILSVERDRCMAV